MTSAVLLNRVVLAGRACSDVVSKRVDTRNGPTTVTSFVLSVPGGPRASGVRIEIEAWSTVATTAQHVTKGRRVCVDGRLAMHEYRDRDDKTHRRFSVRADHLVFLDAPSVTGRDPIDAAAGRRSGTVTGDDPHG